MSKSKSNPLAGCDKDCINGISCDVVSCIHNNHQLGCTAGKIKVGPSFATSTNDTVCDTYKNAK